MTVDATFIQTLPQAFILLLMVIKMGLWAYNVRDSDER
jgi:hypothetical protein